jgi:hypothetical protein
MNDPVHSALANLSILFDAISRRLADMAHARKQRLIARAARRGRERSIHPLGYWRCTHVCEGFPHGFVKGGLYEARQHPPGTLSIRVIPADHDTWSPYWDERNQRFCYQPQDIDFEYVGKALPVGEACLTSDRPRRLVRMPR